MAKDHFVIFPWPSFFIAWRDSGKKSTDIGNVCAVIWIGLVSFNAQVYQCVYSVQYCMSESFPNLLNVVPAFAL